MPFIRPSWLPNRVSPDKVEINELKDIFEKELLCSRLSIDDKKIVIDSISFEHIVTRSYGTKKGKREFEPDRASRINWIKPIIENCRDSNIKKWDFLEKKKKIRTYL